MMREVRLGRWETVLDGVECDLLLTDPPYGEKTHAGAADETTGYDDANRAAVDYSHWTAGDVEAFVDSWAPRTRCWIAALTSHDLVDYYLSSYRANGFYDFAPVGIVITGMGVRMQGDGPASWTLYLCVGRRKAKKLSTATGAKGIWRALPGGYHGPRAPGMAGGRGKPPWLCEALVRDYSDPGMTVCDPCAGWGSFLSAAVRMGRGAIGAELDPAAHEIAARVVRGERARPVPHQQDLIDLLSQEAQR